MSCVWFAGGCIVDSVCDAIISIILIYLYVLYCYCGQWRSVSCMLWLVDEATYVQPSDCLVFYYYV